MPVTNYISVKGMIIRVGKKPGFFQKNQKTRFFWFKPGFFGLNQVSFQSHICVFMNESSLVLEQ